MSFLYNFRYHATYPPLGSSHNGLGELPAAVRFAAARTFSGAAVCASLNLRAAATSSRESTAKVASTAVPSKHVFASPTGQPHAGKPIAGVGNLLPQQVSGF